MDFDQNALKHKLIMKAWKDAKFRDRLLKNPQETIEAFLKEETSGKVSMPKNFKYRVIEEEANTITFVLPRSPASSGELSETELQVISAGSGNWAPTGKELCQ